MVRFKSLLVRRKFSILLNGVQHRGVMLAAKLAADFRQGGGGELLHQVHGDLAGKGDGLGVRAYL